jgi:hypothetical protein
MAQFVFRAAMGDVVTKWSQAGEKHYTGLALIRESKAGVTASMLRVSDKASADEYRSLASAARELADMADKCAEVAEQAKVVKLDKGQVERIREALKNQKPADRLNLRTALAVAGITVTLADFGYDEATGKPVAEKPPTPPATNGQDAVAAALAAVGK